MKDIMHTMILQKGESFEQSHVDIPDVWQHRSKEFVSIFCNVKIEDIVLLIPTTKVKEVISLLSQYSAS